MQVSVSLQLPRTPSNGAPSRPWSSLDRTYFILFIFFRGSSSLYCSSSETNRTHVRSIRFEHANENKRRSPLCANSISTRVFHSSSFTVNRTLDRVFFMPTRSIPSPPLDGQHRSRPCSRCSKALSSEIKKKRGKMEHRRKMNEKTEFIDGAKWVIQK